MIPGTAEVTVDGVLRLGHEKEAAYLPIGCMNRLVSPNKTVSEQIEVKAADIPVKTTSPASTISTGVCDKS